MSVEIPFGLLIWTSDEIQSRNRIFVDDVIDYIERWSRQVKKIEDENERGDGKMTDSGPITIMTRNLTPSCQIFNRSFWFYFTVLRRLNCFCPFFIFFNLWWPLFKIFNFIFNRSITFPNVPSLLTFSKKLPNTFIFNNDLFKTKGKYKMNSCC